MNEKTQEKNPIEKSLSIKVVETNLDKLEAFAIAKTSKSISAKAFKEIPFRVEGYVITDNTITATNTKTGEVVSAQVMRCLSLKLKDGEIVGTNSKTLLTNFKDILGILEDAELQIDSREMIIRSGESANGSFNTIEIVF